MQSGVAQGWMGRRYLAWGHRVVLFLLFGLLSFAGITAERRLTVTEYDLKANWVFQFTKFVEWPPEALGPPDAPFVLGILGTNPFGAALEQIVSGQKVKNHSIQLRYYLADEDCSGCQLVFVGRSEVGRLASILESLKGRSVLTVGETSDFIALGGMVNLELVDKKIRCDLNKVAADKAGLRLNPQLRSVARSVKE